MNSAQGLRQQEIQWDRDDRAVKAAAAASSAASFNRLDTNDGQTMQMPAGMSAKKDQFGNTKGFAFVDQKGQPVSAVKFAQTNKIPIGTLLYQMGQAGDTTAARAYNWFQSTLTSDLGKSGRYMQTPAYRQAFSSLTWGT